MVFMVVLAGAAGRQDGDMQLPLVKTDIQDLSLVETKWKSVIDPLLANPLNNASILENIVLVSGNNAIPHLLGRMQQGWFITDLNAAVTIFRYQPLNARFLYLTVSGAATVSLGVF